MNEPQVTTRSLVFATAQACVRLLAAVVVCLPAVSIAQIPPPGTVIQNTASSTHLVGATVQSVTSNTTSLTVGAIPAGGVPVLTKAFASASVAAGSAVGLVFRLTNSAGNPSQSGIAFVDTLPSGLRLSTGASGVVVGAGCTGNVTLVAPSTISFSAGAMSAGVVTCDIAINGVTDNGAANASCAGNPAAFTNGPTSISGATNVTNGVTNQCLVVTPTLTVTATPVCVLNAPYVDYNATLLGVGAPGGMTVTWRKPTGEVVRVLAAQPLTGRLLWPGAAVDAGGNPLAWPGWALIEGEWVQINDGLRPNMEVVFQAGATTLATVSYPSTTPACNPNPPNVFTTPDMTLNKFISENHGPSPSGTYTVMLRFANPGALEGVKTNVSITDDLPPGMTFVPGTLKLTTLIGAQTQPLPGASGTFSFAATTGSYSSSPSNVSVQFAELGQNVGGLITFDVSIAPGLQVDSILKNTAVYSYTRSTGVTIQPRRSNTFEFRISAVESIKLVGMTVPSVDPGSTVTFDNVLTNLTGRTDTFDITLKASNYPAGTIFKLYKADGITLLGDSSGNGIPDTGPLAAGASYKVVLKAQLPNGISGGPYSISKLAQSVSNTQVSAEDKDTVTAIASACRVVFQSDNAGRVAPGGALVYTHVLVNVGNCPETITVPSSFFTNSLAGWTSQGFVDGMSGTNGSIAGVLDGTDIPLSTTTTFTLAPGGQATILVRVAAPQSAVAGSSNLTSLRINAGSSGPLTVIDTTTVANGTTGQLIDEITSFIDPGFLRPTVWGFIGKPLYLRANAPSCNADPTVIERRTIIITGPNGEREEIIAIETGANTGIFVADGMMVRLPPVAAGNGTLEGMPYDVFQVELVGCGKRIATTVTLIDPSGVVFDSRSNAPVSGATVQVFLATGGVCTNTPATVKQLLGGQVVAAPSSFTTSADGRYEFPLLAPGEYCLRVTPPNGFTFASAVPAGQLPPGRNIVVTGPTSGGSYGGVFRVGPETGPVIVDVPVDGGLIGGLFVQKLSMRSIVEIGEFLDYNVTVSNNTGYALNQANVVLTDTLPVGFTYVKGSARKAGVPLADPAGGVGPNLAFDVGHLAKAQQVKISYRVRVGPGAMQGDGINRVVASYRPGTSTSLYSESNVATAKVTISGGIFSDRGYIIGKVFFDCNKDGVQGPGPEDAPEVGVPGVRLFLEDGTNVVSDSEGKFSFYGLLAKTHVLKIDRTSLPRGVVASDFGAISSRNLGRGDSRIVDLKNGEMHLANFALQNCAPTVTAEIQERRKQAAGLRNEIEGRLQQKLEADPSLRPSNDIKALPATGVVGTTAPIANVPAPPMLGSSGEAPVTSIAASPGNALTTALPSTPSVRSAGAMSRSVPQEIALEKLIETEDNTLGFVGLKDGQIAAGGPATIRVKGAGGAAFALLVNGKQVGNDRIGKKAAMESRQIEGWEFVGVYLKPGENTLVVRQRDSFGNERGEASIRIQASGALSRIRIDVAQVSREGAIADGKTPAKVAVKLVDANGMLVAGRTLITLDTSLGRWQGLDLNDQEPGFQTFVEGGLGEFELLPPVDPGEATIRVFAADVKEEAKLDFLPNLRELIAAGVIEGVLNLRKMDTRALTPARAQDGFEQELSHIARHWGDGKRDAAARAAMFLKGKVKGEYLLTLSYDSDKNTRERLFRDIQPDEFYPVYGDSSVRAFDAQSTGRFYVRIDNKKSYLLYGDYNTSQPSEARKLSNYSRSLTGVKQHFDSGPISANVFASRDTTRQIVDEIRANGTSGPFTLSRASGLVNSEKLEVLVRDRNQPSIVLRATLLARFVDYELEPLTGRILLKSPIPSLDENLNPLSIRITYEVDQGGTAFWVFGGDVQAKLSGWLEVGASYVQDQNPLDKFRMSGVNAVAKLADKSFLIAEIAETRREQVSGVLAPGERRGHAERIELRHSDSAVEASFYAGRADDKFDNSSSGLARGRLEFGGKLAYRLDEKTRIKAELLRTEDTQSNSHRDGALVVAERTLENGLRIEAGLRQARETQSVQSSGSTPAPSEVTAARARMSGDVPGLVGATAYLEGEVDVKDSARKIAAVGADYKLGTAGRAYARYEFISSLTGPYGLNSQQRQNSTVVGISTDYMKDGNVFSEYRVRDAISGGDAEAALGLRNLWHLSDGLALSTGFERVHTLSGTGQGESTALTFGLEYTANPLWKGSTRLELRDGFSSDSILATVAAASKLNRDWTLLGRNTYSLIKNKGQSTGEIKQDRLQAGLAYRDTDSNTWNGLGRVEHRSESDTSQQGIALKRTVELISIHANWQPRRPFNFSGRYAAKWAKEQSNGVRTRNSTHLLGGRAIWDFAPRWDAALNVSTMFSRGSATRQYGFGLELGYMLMDNLWVSAGYNVFGYREDDLAAGEYTNKGIFVRLRYKFDEDLFGGTQSKQSIQTPNIANSAEQVRVGDGQLKKEETDPLRIGIAR